ncbi:MAG: class I SAM-dependent methyltransferase [Bacteroidia bacterium]|nr:class I SAM-dependent methyltransferase [Bacteroidia bacterium]
MTLARTVQFIYRFCRYYLSAGNRHSLQAPFAYRLNEAVFRRDRKAPEQESIESLRRELLHTQRMVAVRDFGAGFSGKVYRNLKVSYIAKHSAKPPRYARMLFRLVQHLQPATVLELGTSLGISALYQAAGHPQARVITLEGCPNTAALARENFRRFPQFNIEQVEGAFEDTLPSLLQRLPDIDYLFIDGHHRLEPTLRYIDLCFPKLSQHAVVVVDDINWSAEMQQAWQQLKADPRFNLSIDVFMMGLLFVSKDLSKENFVLRY